MCYSHDKVGSGLVGVDELPVGQGSKRVLVADVLVTVLLVLGHNGVEQLTLLRVVVGRRCGERHHAQQHGQS